MSNTNFSSLVSQGNSFSRSHLLLRSRKLYLFSWPKIAAHLLETAKWESKQTLGFQFCKTVSVFTWVHRHSNLLLRS